MSHSLFNSNLFTKQIFKDRLFSSSLTNSHIEVEYIESTGTQYIDTLVTGGCLVELTYEVTGTSTSYAVDTLLGFQNSGSPWASSYLRRQPVTVDKLAYNTFGYYSSTQSITNYDSGQHTISASFFKDTSSVILDGTTIKDEAIDAPTDCNYSLYLFAMNTAGTAEKFAQMKLYGMSIYSNKEKTNLVRQFKPVLLNSSEYCLYDTVTNSYFKNKGTGNFLGGSPI